MDAERREKVFPRGVWEQANVRSFQMIRIAKTEDANAVARVHLASWRVAYAGIVQNEVLEGLSVAERAESWRGQLEDGQTIVLVAENAGKVIGFVAGGDSRDEDGNAAKEVYAIYVAPAEWGGGVGREN